MGLIFEIIVISRPLCYPSSKLVRDDFASHLFFILSWKIWTRLFRLMNTNDIVIYSTAISNLVRTQMNVL